LAWHGIPEFSDDVFMSPNAPKHMPRIGDVVGFVEVKESQACCAAARWLQREWIYKLRRISCSFLPYILPQASHFPKTKKRLLWVCWHQKPPTSHYMSFFRPSLVSSKVSNDIENDLKNPNQHAYVFQSTKNTT
jgi:hypothetical protein